MHLPGPVDAAQATSSGSDDDTPAKPSHAPRARRSRMSDADHDGSAVVVGAGMEEFTQIDVINAALAKYGVFKAAEHEYEQASAASDEDQKARLAREEAMAVAELVRALQGYGSQAAKELRESFHKSLDGDASHTVRISHGRKP